VTARESHLVELVDESGVAAGSMSVEAAHQAPGALHRAFSVVLIDPDGRVLLQRRAPAKTRFAGRWANACCGHPQPGVTPEAAAAVRMSEELGIPAVPLQQLGVYVYQAADDATGRVEHEYDHVLLGRVPADLEFALDPLEADAVQWVVLKDLLVALDEDPYAYSPWLAGVIALLE
jgi:isopentenyl-diphosphate delta-isomerase